MAAFAAVTASRSWKKARHPGESRDLAGRKIPAFAGMTV
jgi:hypothetical protein